MKKIIILLIIILILILGIIAAFLYLNKPGLNVNAPTNINATTGQPEAQALPAYLTQPQEFIKAATAAGVDYWTYYSLVEMVSICEAKAGNESLSAKCDQIDGKYLVQKDNPYCKSKASYLVLVYLAKAQNKEKFVQICQDYKTYRPQIGDCSDFYDKFVQVKDFCDDKDKGCPALVSDEAKASCQKPVNLDTLVVSDLQDLNCQKTLPLLNSKSASDCQLIKDDLSRLLCLDLYDQQVCPFVQAKVGQGDFTALMDKYPLQKCCLEGDAEEKANLPF